MDESLRDVPKSLRFLHIQHNSECCDNQTQSESVCQLLPSLTLLSSISTNNNNINRTHPFECETSDRHSNERSVQTYNVHYTNPKELFNDHRLSKSLPQLKDIDYLPSKDIQSFTETNESLNSENITHNWKSKVDFLFTGVTLSLGLNNIWRFPYYAHKCEGPGSLLALYIFQLFVCGFPLLCMEYAIGQFTKHGLIRALGNLCPILKGIGMVSTLVICLIIPLYNTLNSWTLLYFFKSFHTTLPWIKCTNTTQNCLEIYYENHSMKLQRNQIDFHNSSFYLNKTLTKEELTFQSDVSIISTSDFFHNKLFAPNSGESLSELQWQLLGITLFIWIVVFISQRKSISFSKQSNNYLSSLPFFVLAVLLLRTFTLEGAAEGVLYFLRPTWNGIFDTQNWMNAAVLCLHSLGTVLGVSLSMAACNKDHNNIVRDAHIICLINLLSIITIGCIIFGTLGFMANQSDKRIEHVLLDDAGMPYIVYSHILASMPLASFWSAIFYITIFCLGIRYQICLVQTLMISIEDSYNSIVKHWFGSHKYFLLLICIGFSFIGLLFIVNNGLHLIELVDFYIASALFIMLAFLELILVSWFYGGCNLSNVIKQKTRKSIGNFLPFCWIALTPILLLAIIAYFFQSIASKKDTKHYPKIIKTFVVWLSIAIMLIIPLVSYFQIRKMPDLTIIGKILHSCRPQHIDDKPIKEELIQFEELLFNNDNCIIDKSQSFRYITTDIPNQFEKMPFDFSLIQNLERETFI